MGQRGETASIVMERRADRPGWIAEPGGPARQHAAVQPDVLASGADRDVAARMLPSAFAEGRLTSGEHAERVRAAYGARTLGELAGLTADLPGPAGGAGGRQALLVPDEAMDRCLLWAPLICCPPAGITWLLAARRRSRPRPGQRLGLAQADMAATDERGSDW